MPTIMEELYYGNIHPTARRHTADSPYVQAAKHRSTNLEKLTATLNEEQRELLEKLQDAQGDMESITRYATFRYALKFGLLLMAEAFTGMDEITGEEDCLAPLR